MKPIIWISILCSIACFLMALNSYFFLQRARDDNNSDEQFAKINTQILQAQDLELLRKATLMLLASDRENVSNSDRILRKELKVIIGISVAMGLMFLINLGYFLKAIRKQRGEPIPR